LTVLQMLFLFAAGLAGGFLNAIAGGATFFTFPAMMAAGLNPISANASSTVALWPASVAAAWAERRELVAQRAQIAPLLGIALAGGLAGALLLLVTPQQTFRALVPVLLLIATLVFAFSGRIIRFIRARRPVRTEGRGLHSPAVLALIGFCAVYGGYFGAGIGIMMMAGLTLAGIGEVHVANAIKNFLAASINGIAVLVFVVSQIVVWPASLVMLAGAVGGGYLGGRAARHIPAGLLRIVVITVGSLLTIWYFVRL
jgi:uncharacterized membrane protein YfcA